MVVLTPRQLTLRNKDDYTFVELLKSCAKRKDINEGTRLHADILKRGLLDKSPYLASTLISMYAKCGLLTKAEDVLYGLPFRDAFCWSALISGYAKQGQGHDALRSFECMQNEGHTPDAVTFISILKACGKIRDANRGKQIHDEIAKRGLLRSNVVLATALVDMYAKCGLLSKAQEVLNELPVRSVATWNALIAGYAQFGDGRAALSLFDRMQRDGFSPDEATFTCTLKACGSVGDIKKGEQLHKEIIIRNMVGQNIVLNNSLVDMYAKCGILAKAKQVLQEIPFHDTVSWNALIAGYTQHGQGSEALIWFEKMPSQGIFPDKITFTTILKTCSSIAAIVKGRHIHAILINSCFMLDDFLLGTTLVDMYAKCEMLKEAHKILEKLPVRNVACWNALISGYAQKGMDHDALNCFEHMQREGISPDAVTFVCILKACGKAVAIEIGKTIHNEILSRGLLHRNILLGTALVDMYAKCGALEKAEEVLDELNIQNIAPWNVLITGYTQQGQAHKALNCFVRMQMEGIYPDIVTLTMILSACGSTGALDKGKEIHDKLITKTLLHDNIGLGAALVDMYVKCGGLTKALEVLDGLPVRDTVTWNTLISGYAQQGQGHAALNCFSRMQREGLSPDSVTYICILKACGSIKDGEKGELIYKEIVDKQLLEKDIVLCAALVDMYVKCGLLEKAEEVIIGLPYRHVATWNALIAGYAQREQGYAALRCFERMQNEGHSPDVVTFICILKACGSTGAIDKGEQIHKEVVHQGLLEKDVVLGTALVDMYAKCGFLSKAHQILDELHIRNVVSWNAIISGYTQQGLANKALDCFERMQKEGISPDAVTMLCVLSACRHSGLVNEAQTYFLDMSRKYGLVPSIEHETYMIEIFAFSGRFDEAMSIVKKMHCSDYPLIWLAILSACKQWGNVKLGRLAFDRAVQLDGNYAVYYILMSNIYAAAGMQKEVDEIETMKSQNGASTILKKLNLHESVHSYSV